MGFDLSTAKPVTASSGGFDLSTAKPVAQGKDPRLAGLPDPSAPPAPAQTEPQGPRDSLLGKVWGATVDPVLSIGSGMAATIPGGVAALYNIATNGKYGTQEGVREAEGAFGAVADAFTYKPRTNTGRAVTEKIGEAVNDSGVVGIPLPELNTLGRSVSSAGGAVRDLARATNAPIEAADAAALAQPSSGSLRDLVRRPPRESTMAGAGAASTREALQRQATADALPVPIKLTRGQRTRSLEDQRFEGETAKMPDQGAPLRNRTVEQNQQILQNFDAFADEAGGTSAPGLRPVGKVVDAALVKRRAEQKANVRQLYNDAAESVEGATPASYKPLSDYIAKFNAEAETGNAPVLSAVKKMIEKLDPEGTGTIPLREFNEIRERVGAISKEGTPNAAFRAPLQQLVDDAVEANGGPGYRQARRAYENFQNEFKNVAVMDKLLRTKPGSKTRAVAYEDIVDTAILKADSLDSVRAIRNTLTKAGDEGVQAWKDLQSETLRQIKERVTKSAVKDQAGADTVSADALNKIIRELDADGRLEFVFTKQGAQRLRDLNEIVGQVKTVPAGTVNTSNTAAVLAGLLDTAVSGTTGLPLPIASGARLLIKRSKDKKLRARVEDSLNPDGTPQP